VNSERGKKSAFKYSKPLVAKAGNWTYASLNAFLAKPKEYITGSKMAFAGIKKARDRAAVIAFLRGLSDSPAPLP
jgi:cytochrome c